MTEKLRLAASRALEALQYSFPIGTYEKELEAKHRAAIEALRDALAEPGWGGEQGLLTFEFPKHMEHPAGRVNLTAAYLLEYWASKGTIPRYDGVIDGLLAGAAEIFKVAKPVRSNTASCEPSRAD